MFLDRQVVRYGFIGALCASLDLSLFLLLVYFGYSPPIVGSVTYLIGTLTSYLFNRKLTFNKADKTLLRAVLFIFVSLIGAALTSVLLIWTEGLAGLSPLFWRLATLPFIFLIQFMLNKYITFSKLDYRFGR